MKQNIYKIKIDTILELKNEHFTVSSSDINSHKLNIEVTQNNEPYPLTDLTVNIHFLKSDGKLNEQEATIDNAIEGKATCILETNSINKQGRVRAEVLISKNGDLLTTKRFEFYATNPLASDKVIESTTEFPLLKQMVLDEIERKKAELLRVENEVDRLALTQQLQTLQGQLQGYLDNPEQFRGPQGEQGIQGIQGPKGEQGIKGNTGERGLQGVQGLKGDKGDKGDQGVQGIQGDTGEVSLAQLNVVDSKVTSLEEEYTSQFTQLENVVNNRISNSYGLWVGTQNEYDLLPEYYPNVLYHIVEVQV